MAKRTVDEIIELGLEAIGDQIQALRTSGGLEPEMGKLLCDYVKAACAVSKNAREQETHGKLNEMSDADLERLLAIEIQRSPELLRRVLAKANVRAS